MDDRLPPSAKEGPHFPADKVLDLASARKVGEEARAAGRRLVLAHGVFDLLHVGHLRHLQSARRLGDILVVSITADAHVRKGPDRPVFPAELRAEMLASKTIVDAVMIVDDPSAIPAIEALRPAVYVKGKELARAEDDVTGKIVSERAAVEKYGGTVAFTDELVFSSSELLNTHFDVFTPEVRDYLKRLKADPDIEKRLFDLIESLADLKVLIVGDAIIDEYQYVAVMGKSAKEQIIATQYESEELFAGGVFAAANHLASFCGEVEVLTCLGALGHGDNYEAFVRQKLAPNVTMTTVARPAAPTTRKTRFVDSTHFRKLFEVYHAEDNPLPPGIQAEFDWLVSERGAAADCVIVADFGHGLIAPSTIDVLESLPCFLAVNAQANSANIGYNLITKYRKADYACVDAMEGRLAVRDKHADPADVSGRLLPPLLDCPKIVVTHGRAGCYTFDRDTEEVTHVPAFVNWAVDTVGAGDAFFVVSAAFLAAGGSIDHAGLIGNVVGGIKVGIVGHRSSVDKATTLKHLQTLLK